MHVSNLPIGAKGNSQVAATRTCTPPLLKLSHNPTARARWLISVPVENTTPGGSGGHVPADTMSALLTAVKEMTAGISSEVIPESTAAASSCATRERLPVRRIFLIGSALPALAMERAEATRAFT